MFVVPLVSGVSMVCLLFMVSVGLVNTSSGKQAVGG